MSKKIRMIITLAVMILTICAACCFSSSAADDGKWICAWSTAPTEIGIDGYENISAYLGEVTGRTVLTPTADGTKLRIRISNVYGDEPMTLTRVTVSKSKGGSKIDGTTTKIVTFNQGYQSVTVPAGKEMYSDPVVFDVKAQEDIAISFYAHEFTEIKTMGLSGADTYLTLGQDATSMESFGLMNEIEQEEALSMIVKILGLNLDLKLAYSFVKVVPCIASLDVYSDTNAYTVVVTGDSTVSNEFPLYLSQSINNQNIKNVGVAGKGIIGNRLMGDGLGYGSLIFGESLIDRFQRDVLSQSGVEYVIVKIGANDIIHPVCSDIIEQYPGIEQPTAQELVNGYKTIFKMCHDAGVKVIAVGITQWKGSTRNYLGTGDKYVRTSAQFKADWKIAQTVNNWLANTTLHDGYVNLNDISADPNDSAALLPEYTIDGIHPSDTLQKVWADYFPLSLIGVGKGPSSVTLDRTAMGIYAGYGRRLTATVLPADAEDKGVTWSSSNTAVARVSKNGYVLGVSNGKAVITCTTNKGGLVAKCTVTVVTKPTSVTLNRTTAAVYTTKSFTLTATVAPATASNKNVTWSTSDSKVATVTQSGVVTGVGSGYATITCKTVSGSLEETCLVKVVKKTEVSSIKLNKSTVSLYKGYKWQLSSTVYPTNATFKNVKWTSSNANVVTVDSTGKLWAMGKGTATVTCTSVDNPMVKASCTVKVYIKTAAVTLNKTSVSLYEGEYGKLVPTIYPTDASVKTVTWKSLDPSIAIVSRNGTLLGVKAGTTYVTCTTVNGGFVAKCKVTVTKIIKTTSVKLPRTSVSINDGSTAQFAYTVYPSNASNKSVTWSSSNVNVVKVYSNGKIYAVNPGTAVITCKTNDTGKTAKCTVTVKAVTPTSVKINKTSVNINYNKTLQLTATVSPSNATNKAVKWSSSDPSVVYVNSNGVIKGLKPGKSAVISCTTVSGQKTAKCTVKVNPISVTKVTINRTSATIAPGKTVTIVPTVYPSNATNKTVRWTTSNSAVATVSSSGVVKGVADGKAVIGCVTNDGGFVAVCVVEVKTVLPIGVMLDKSNVRANVGVSFKITATIVPETATNKTVVWTSSDTAVAKVDSTGKVTPVGKGTCEIKARTVSGNCVAICKLTVV